MLCQDRIIFCLIYKNDTPWKVDSREFHRNGTRESDKPTAARDTSLSATFTEQMLFFPSWISIFVSRTSVTTLETERKKNTSRPGLKPSAGTGKKNIWKGVYRGCGSICLPRNSVRSAFSDRLNPGGNLLRGRWNKRGERRGGTARRRGLIERRLAAVTGGDRVSTRLSSD